MLNLKSFEDLRTSVYSLFIHDPELYYYYAKSLLAELVDVVNNLSGKDIVSDENQVNTLLRLIRQTHSSRSRVITDNAVDLLNAHSIDASLRSGIFLSGEIACRCHTETTSTVKLPVHSNIIDETEVSGSSEAANVRRDLKNTHINTFSQYISAAVIKELVGGNVLDVIELGRGDKSDLVSYIDGYDNSFAARLKVRALKVHPTLTREYEEDFVLTRDSTAGDYINELLPEVIAWVSIRETVSIPQKSVGAMGPLYVYPLSRSLIDLERILRPGMSLIEDESVRVSSVVGERVTLSSATSIYGTHAFSYRCISLWTSYLKLLADIKVTGETEEDRLNSLNIQARQRAKMCKALIRGIPQCGSDLRFDIKSAHYAIGADNAYNLLERGRLIEYHNLTEEQSKRSSVMSIAAAHIRAGTRL